MRSLKINETEIVFYTSIKELPIEVSKQFWAYLLQDAGIGATIEDVDDHLSRLIAFLQAKKTDEAIEEAKNLRYNLFSMLSRWDYKSLAFGCLIKSVNGRQLDDYSLEGLNELLARLSVEGLTGQMVDDIVSDLKKNLIPNESFTSLNISETMQGTLTR